MFDGVGSGDEFVIHEFVITARRDLKTAKIWLLDELRRESEG